MVSVVIPTYNRAAMLRAALQSVFEQTYRDFEIVVVDDGSTDDTRAFLESCGPPVRCYYGRHGGAARARNLGMERARGRYICYLDSDDLYYPHKLALQVEHLERNPDTVMVYTEFSAFDDAGFWDEFHLRTYHKSAYRNAACAYGALFEQRSPLADNPVIRAAAQRAGTPLWLTRSEYRGRIFDAYLHNTVVFTNSMMFRRRLLDQVGPQDPCFGHFHDLEFALRICREGLVTFIDNPTYKLRYHPGQVSSRKGPGGDENAVKLQRDLLRVARKHALKDVAYYRQNRSAADRLMANRHRAAAVPMIAYGGGNAHRRKYFPRRARRYLAQCAKNGHPATALYLVSFMPRILKRLYFRLHALWRPAPAALPASDAA
jgi:glycosyltransferase involved in cell wall biosynthesis